MENKFNKEFEDLGWSQMQKMLDQEMPVAEKKRRRGVLWLFLLSSLMTFSGGFYYFKNKKENVEKAQIMQSTNKELIVENKELNSPINSINNAEFKTENKDKLITDLKNKNNKIEQQIITQSSSFNNDKPQLLSNNATLEEATLTTRATVKVAPTQNAAPLPQHVASPTQQVGAIFTVALVTDAPIVADVPVVKEASLVKNPLIVKEAPLVMDNLPMQTPPQYLNENKDIYKYDTAEQGMALTQELVLPLTINKLGEIKSNDLSELALEKFNRPIVSKNIIRHKSNPKTHLSLILGVHTEGGKKIDGGQIGLITHTYLDNKWSFFAGLNYRKTTVQVDSSTDALVGYQAVSTTPGTTNILPKSLDLIPVKKILLNQLNYLELPIGFNYAFNKKMSVTMGIKAAYLFSTNVRISADSSVFFIKDMSQKSSYTIDQSTNYSVTQLGLQRWDFAAIGGINYSVAKRLQLGLRYDYGLNSVVKRANWTAYNRFLGFNVVYLLK
jgi:hypothetical protein